MNYPIKFGRFYSTFRGARFERRCNVSSEYEKWGKDMNSLCKTIVIDVSYRLLYLTEY